MMALREPLGDAAAPIMSNQVKARLAIARGRNDRHRVVHQVVGKLAWIRSRARRIAALAWCYGAIAHIAEACDLRAPATHRFRKAVQQQHQRRTALAGRQRIEGKLRGDGDLFEGRYGAILELQSRPVHGETDFS